MNYFKGRAAKDNEFVIDGVSSKNWSMVVSGDSTFSTPERDAERISVPGRNGDLIIDNGRWNNVDVTYNDCFIRGNFTKTFGDFRRFLGTRQGYVRLEDTFHPDEYRLANPKSVNVNLLGVKYGSGAFDVTFNCKPQRFLKSGEKPIQMFPAVITTANASMGTPYIPIANETGTIKLTMTCPDDYTITTKVSSYLSDGTLHIEMNGPDLRNGGIATWQVDRSIFEGASYFRLVFGGMESHDDVNVRIQCETEYNGKTFDLDAILGEYIKIQNPTGYRTAPLFEFYSSFIPTVRVSNYTDGELTDYMQFIDFAEEYRETKYLYLDCDLQYLYNENGDNLTNDLRISDSWSESFQGLVFPQLGADEIVFRMFKYNSDISIRDGIGLVLLTPRWWKI